MDDIEEFLIWESEQRPDVAEDDGAYWNAIGNGLSSPTLSGKPPWNGRAANHEKEIREKAGADRLNDEERSARK